MTFRSLRIASVTFAAAFVALAGCGDETTSEPTCDDCFSPPPRACDGDRAISFSPFGECVAGTCVYEPRETDCAANDQLCESGQCVDPPDPCEGVTCDAPPETACEGDELVTWGRVGVCDEGDCSYDATRTDCAVRGQICDGDRCVTPADPCEDVTCDTPPDNVCEGDTVVIYRAGGTCSEGACEYEGRTRVNCANSDRFCFEGECLDVDPCEDVTCDAPPASTCDGTVRVDYADAGTCEAGFCNHAEIRTDCADTDQDCAGGACVERDVCSGVTCDRPPRDVCDGDTARQFPTVGVCTDGVCAYDETQVDCAESGQICDGGACVDVQPCDPAECTTPPNNLCRENVLVRYRLPGVCDDELCAYPTEEQDCTETGRICLDGACEVPSDLCAVLVCEEPPAPFCSGSNAIVYEAVGTCFEGECEYDLASVTNCAETGGFCVEGLCTDPDPCDGIDCTAPEASCIGNTLREYLDDGVCDDGVCDFAEQLVETDCGTVGRICQDGACALPGEVLTAGELAFTEVFFDAGGELIWVEFREPFDSPIDLSGLELRRGDRTYTFPAGSTVDGGAYVTIGVDERFDFVWPAGFGAPVAGDDPLALEGSETVSEIALDAIALRNAAFQWDPSTLAVAAAEDIALWCEASLSPGRAGTPGEPNYACAANQDWAALRINEIARLGAGTAGVAERWIELSNGSAEPLDLSGLVVVVGSERLVFPPGSATLLPGGFYVLAASPSAAGGSVNLVTSIISGVGGNGPVGHGVNGAPARLLPQFTDSAWPVAAGATYALRPGASDPLDLSEWCRGAGSWDTSPNTGSPGSPNTCLD